MKQLSLRFDDIDYHKLRVEKDKTNLSWEKFVLLKVMKENDGKRKRLCVE